MVFGPLPPPSPPFVSSSRRFRISSCATSGKPWSGRSLSLSKFGRAAADQRNAGDYPRRLQRRPVLCAGAMLASITGGAVLPFDLSAFDDLAALLQAASVLAVGGEASCHHMQSSGQAN